MWVENDRCIDAIHFNLDFKIYLVFIESKTLNNLIFMKNRNQNVERFDRSNLSGMI